MGTSFTQVYNCFYSKITDDMYMELDVNQTEAMSEELLINALPWFEFPRVNINNYDLTQKAFYAQLSYEEINIIATYMLLGWFDQQLASVEVTRMKYSGSDFKMTSQANHMNKLKELRKEYERIGFHLQRLYKRRKTDTSGNVRSTFGSIMATSVRQGNVSNVNSGSGSNNNNDTPSDPTPTPPPSSGGDSWEDMEDTPVVDSPSDEWDDME